MSDKHVIQAPELFQFAKLDPSEVPKVSEDLIETEVKTEEQTKVVTSESILASGETTIQELSSWFEAEKIKLDVKRIAIISDPHSNFTALKAVLEDMETREYDAVICLGDLVGYYTEPNEVINAIKGIVNVCVIGNHDFAIVEPEQLLYSTLQEAAKAAIDHNMGVISQENKEWIEKLPFKVILETPYADLTLVHGDPITIFGYIYGTSEALFEKSILNSLSHIDTEYLLVGHSHLQGEYFADDGKIYVNPGAIGQPRDKDPRAAYAIIDLEAKTNELIRVEYDIDATMKQVIDCCLPQDLAMRLALGQ
ncbi:MAG: metallophosphoesterase family protein [Candidatus Kariarchaeaceae archaeon]|jgi:putative phosphoesterase